MLDSIITSKTRIKLLLKFFLNSNTKGYLRNLEQEFGESTNSIRIELNRLESADLLHSEFKGNKKYFKANTDHPLFKDINNIVKNFVEIDVLIEKIISKIGNLDTVYLTGDLAKGIDSQFLEIILIGLQLDTGYIERLVLKAENILKRKVKYIILQESQFREQFKNLPVLLIWSKKN